MSDDIVAVTVTTGIICVKTLGTTTLEGVNVKVEVLIIESKEVEQDFDKSRPTLSRYELGAGYYTRQLQKGSYADQRSRR